MKKIFFLLIALTLGGQLGFSQPLISQGKPASASTQGAGANRNAAAGNDGNATDTRWESASSDPQWWQVDLQAEYYVTSVEIDWETASSKEYKILLSNDATFTTGVTELAHITNQPTGNHSIAVIPGSTEVKGRYLRMHGISRNTGYGHSFFEFRAYGTQTLTPVDVSFFVPHIAQYLEVNFTPTDLNGLKQQIIQYNPQEGSTYTLKYNQYSSFSMELGDYRGDFEYEFWATKEGSPNDSLKGKGSLENIPVYSDMKTGVKLIPILVPDQPPVADAGKSSQVITAPVSQIELDGSRSKAFGTSIVSYKWEQVGGPITATIVSPNAVTTNITGLTQLGDYGFKLTVMDGKGQSGETIVSVSVKAPETIDFTLTAPEDKVLITNTRKPTLTWNAITGATKYEIYVNITRDDYDWYASGNLLDRYTKVGESTGTSYTLTTDLSDRWTYKWYVLATTPSGTKYSDIRQFGLYIPTLTTRSNAVPVRTSDGISYRDLNKNGTMEPYEDWRNTPEVRVADLLGRMSLQDKVKQLFYSQGGGESVEAIDGFSFAYGAGGVATVQDRASQTTFGIPTAFSGDKIGGLQTIFPTQLGLAATRDVQLAWKVGDAQRIEFKETGFTGTLGPLAEVCTKVLYNRVHEGGGENADENAAMLRALICGMQGGPEVNPSSMMITVKHWPSQGAGGEGPTQYDATTIKYHMKPWYAIVECNAASVMPGYSSSPFLDPSGAGSNSSKRIIDYLKNDLAFNGFIVTDWLGANTNQSIASIGAGIDVLGGAPSGPTDATALVDAVGMDRVNDACRRVLEWKFRAGQFENPYGPTPAYYNAAHYDLAVEAARKVVTLLTNDEGILPLKLNSGDQLVVGGPRSRWMNKDNDPNVIWQAIYYNDPQNKVKTYVQAIKDKATPKGITVFQQDTYCPYGPASDTNRGDSNPEASNPKVAILFIGERSGTHGSDWGDGTANISQEQLDILRKYKNMGAKVVSVVLMQRQYVLTEVTELSDAVLCVYRGGNGITQAIAECLFGEFAPTGKLPFQIPRSMDQIGTNSTGNQIEKWDLPYDLGATEAQRIAIRNQIANDLPVIPTGNPLFQYGHGLQRFGVLDPDVTPPLPFELVSPANNSELTETTATLTWEASSDAESSIAYYEVYLNEEKKASVTTTSCNLFGLEAGSYTWRVVAVNGVGLEQASTSTFNFTVKINEPSDDTPPLPFDLLSPADNTVFSETSATLTWETSSDPESSIAYYEVYLNEEKKASVTTTSYDLSELVAGDYSWRVVAVNGAGLEQASTSTFNFSINTTNIESIGDGQIAVYPNPFDEYITVNATGSEGIIQARIVDVTGQVIKELKNESAVFTVDMSGCQSGIYFLSLERKDGTKVVKLIKK